MVLWRSQADEIDDLRAEVRNLRGEMAAQQAELEEMDTHSLEPGLSVAATFGAAHPRRT